MTQQAQKLGEEEIEKDICLKYSNVLLADILEYDVYNYIRRISAFIDEHDDIHLHTHYNNKELAEKEQKIYDEIVYFNDLEFKEFMLGLTDAFTKTGDEILDKKISASIRMANKIKFGLETIANLKNNNL